MTPVKPSITSTTRTLHFDDLEGSEFERLSLWLIEREGYQRVQHYGDLGSEQGRDIVAWQATQGDRRVVFQCKNVKRFTWVDIEKELTGKGELKGKKIFDLPVEKRPHILIFIVACSVPADARDKAVLACKQQGIECDFWAHTELDMKVKKYPEIVEEFFQLPTEAMARMELEAYQPPPLPKKVEDLQDLDGLPPGSRMPFSRNAVFTGREADLKALAHCLLYGGETAVGVTQSAAATGAGGLGKTQLAVEFCYRYGRFFHGVHWINAAQDLTAEIAACGSAMGLSPWPETLPEQMQATLIAWARSGVRLVVLDNVEDPQVVEEWLPKLSRAKVLLTSRQRDWPADLGLALLPLDSLPRGESLLLLRRLAPRLEKVADQELETIAGRLGDLPLALNLAGRYLHDRKGLSIEGFLEELEQAGGALKHSALKDWTDHNPTQHDTNLAASFTLSWNKLDSQAQRLFCAAGYCAANTPIPWGVFYRLEGAGESEKQAAVDRALGALEDGGLVSLAEVGPLVHPLLAEFARLQEGAAEESALPGLADALEELSYEANESGLPERFKPLRAHVEAVAGWAEEAGLEQAGSLWNRLGWHLDDVAEYTGARAAYERALEIFEKQFGPEHSEVAAIVNNLGQVLRAQGDLAGAKAAYERALAIRKEKLGDSHSDTATTLNDLGNLFWGLGDYETARGYLEQAIKVYENVFGDQHPWVATAVNNLGGVLQAQGDYAGAKAAYERALRIDEAAFGPDHPKVATDVNNLGSVLRAQGDLAGAQAAFERALRIDEAAFGPDHPNVAIRVNNLGLVLWDLGDLAGAQAAYERALGIIEKHLGPQHPYVAASASNLGLVLQDLGDLAGARAACERALRIDEAAFGPDHPEVARDVNNLGGVLQAQGDLAGAKAAYERALAIFEKYLPPDHPNIRIVRGNLEQVTLEMEGTIHE